MGGTQTIRVTGATALSPVRTGGAAGLAAFAPGDEIIAEGQWGADGFAARALATLYRPIEGRLTGRQGDRLQTTAGVVLLTPTTRPVADDRLTDKPLAQLAVGDEIAALTWRDPASGDLDACLLGVKKARR